MNNHITFCFIESLYLSVMISTQICFLFQLFKFFYEFRIDNDADSFLFGFFHLFTVFTINFV